MLVTVTSLIHYNIHLWWSGCGGVKVTSKCITTTERIWGSKFIMYDVHCNVHMCMRAYVEVLLISLSACTGRENIDIRSPMYNNFSELALRYRLGKLRLIYDLRYTIIQLRYRGNPISGYAQLKVRKGDRRRSKVKYRSRFRLNLDVIS